MLGFRLPSFKTESYWLWTDTGKFWKYHPISNAWSIHMTRKIGSLNVSSRANSNSLLTLDVFVRTSIRSLNVWSPGCLTCIFSVTDIAPSCPEAPSGVVLASAPAGTLVGWAGSLVRTKALMLIALLNFLLTRGLLPAASVLGGVVIVKYEVSLSTVSPRTGVVVAGTPCPSIESRQYPA